MKSSNENSVIFCAEKVEDGWNPQIVITVADRDDITFKSNVVCATELETEDFCTTIFKILSKDEKKNLRHFKGGRDETFRT